MKMEKTLNMESARAYGWMGRVKSKPVMYHKTRDVRSLSKLEPDIQSLAHQVREIADV